VAQISSNSELAEQKAIISRQNHPVLIQKEVPVTSKMAVQASPTLMESFDPDNTVNLGPRWEKWLSRLDRFFLANNLKKDTNAAQMEAMLFLLAGQRVEEIHGTLTLPADEADSTDDVFTKATTKLNLYFKPKRNHMMEKFNFRTAKQDESETIDTYVTRLRVLAKFCEFHSIDTEIMT